MSVRLIEGDCLDEMPKLAVAGICVDAICTDPPYHLTSGNPSFDWDALKPGGHRTTGSTTATNMVGRGHRTGFMGQKWDGGDIAFQPETWATAASVLRAGGFLLAFGGTRTFHKLVIAIEAGGFVVQDQIAWIFGSGFPKNKVHLKPAFEPICVAYKPGGKRTLQIDECRIPCVDKTPFPVGALSPDGSIKTGLHIKPRGADASINARWPANLAHDGSAEVMEAFAAFGESKSPPVGSMGGGSNRHTIYGDFAGVRNENGYGDAGSAARFFYNSKASPVDRWGSKHPTVKPVELMKWLVQLVTPIGGTVLDPFAGSGTTGVSAMATGRNAILIEQSAEYCADIRARLAHYEGEGRHSLVSKARNRNVEPLGGLFATDEAAE